LPHLTSFACLCLAGVHQLLQPRLLLVHDPATGETWLTPPEPSQEALQDAITALRATFGPELEVWEEGYSPDRPVDFRLDLMNVTI